VAGVPAQSGQAHWREQGSGKRREVLERVGDICLPLAILAQGGRCISDELIRHVRDGKIISDNGTCFNSLGLTPARPRMSFVVDREDAGPGNRHCSNRVLGSRKDGSFVEDPLWKLIPRISTKWRRITPRISGLAFRLRQFVEKTRSHEALAYLACAWFGTRESLFVGESRKRLLYGVKKIVSLVTAKQPRTFLASQCNTTMASFPSRKVFRHIARNYNLFPAC
jgi:hypothetical protein